MTMNFVHAVRVQHTRALVKQKNCVYVFGYYFDLTIEMEHEKTIERKVTTTTITTTHINEERSKRRTLLYYFGKEEKMTTTTTTTMTK